MFGVNGAESFQAEYQKLIDTWMRRFAEMENYLSQNQSKEVEEENKEVEKEVGNKASEPKNIKVWDSDGNVLYEEGKSYNLTPTDIQKLEEASGLLPGEFVEGLPSVKVEVDGNRFFISDNEEVLLNEKVDLEVRIRKGLEERQHSSQEFTLAEAKTYFELTQDPAVALLDDAQMFKMVQEITRDKQLLESSQSLKTDEQTSKQEITQQEQSLEIDDLTFKREITHEKHLLESLQSSEINDQTSDMWIDLIAPIIEAMPVIEPELEQQSDTNLMDFLESNEYRIQEETAEIRSTIEETAIKDKTVTNSDNQKTSEIRNALEESKRFEAKLEVPELEVHSTNGLSALQEALLNVREETLKDVLQGIVTDMEATAAQQEPDPAMEKLIEERIKDRQNPNWWEKISTKVETMVSHVRDNFTQYRAASTLKDFANQMGLQPGDSYQGAEYNLLRQGQGKEYTLTDKQGNELIKFQSSPLGVKVDKSLPPLDATHFQKTEELRRNSQQKHHYSGAFISEGAYEGQTLQRINRITQSLSEYAAKQGGTTKVEGKFSYDWQASGSGSAIIQDKEGKVLMAIGQGHMRSRMSEKDLQHFEQMLPALQNQQPRQHETVRTKSVASTNKQIER